MVLTANGEIYLTTQEALDRLVISESRLTEIRERGRIKRYKIKESACYKRSDLSKLTFDDLMGPITPDEGIMIDREVDERW